MKLKDVKLLIIGSDDIWSIERFYVKYIGESGVNISLFPAQNKFIKYYESSALNKILFRTGLSTFYNTLNEELISFVDELSPNIIWVFKGMEILPSTLKYFKSKNIFLVNYNPDNPFIFSGKGSGNKNVTESVGLYDLHFTYNSAVRDKIKNEFKLPAEILPFGFDVSAEVFEACTKETEILKTCFIGNPDKERAAFITKLAKYVPIDVYGNNWSKFISGDNITIYPAKYEQDCWMILRKYRVQLNLLRIHNVDSHNMRTFEIPGIGGIMLAPSTTEQLAYFREDQEAFFFKDIQECVSKINYIISQSTSDSEMIRENARTASVHNGYSYKSRADYAMNILMVYLSAK
jgi:spore maturation protein CgeB